MWAESFSGETFEAGHDVGSCRGGSEEERIHQRRNPPPVPRTQDCDPRRATSPRIVVDQSRKQVVGPMRERGERDADGEENRETDDSERPTRVHGPARSSVVAARWVSRGTSRAAEAGGA